MNKALLVGNLTRDPEYTTTTSGVAMCRFSIAISRRYTNASGERETDFLNIVTWRGLADNCHKFLRKGSKVGVVGTIQTRTYDAQDGSKRYATDIVADEVEFLNTRNNDEAAGEYKPKAQESVTKLEPIEDDTLPF